MELSSARPGIQGPSPAVVRPTGDASGATGAKFTEVLQHAGTAVVEGQAAASRAVESFASGAQGNLHETLLTVDKAEISLKLLVTVRNRLIDAYREVMRMGA